MVLVLFYRMKNCLCPKNNSGKIVLSRICEFLFFLVTGTFNTTQRLIFNFFFYKFRLSLRFYELSKYDLWLYFYLGAQLRISQFFHFVDSVQCFHTNRLLYWHFTVHLIRITTCHFHDEQYRNYGGYCFTWLENFFVNSWQNIKLILTIDRRRLMTFEWNKVNKWSMYE